MAGQLDPLDDDVRGLCGPDSFKHRLDVARPRPFQPRRRFH
ncbi:hypothetical protein E1H18_432 [Caulobacter sp. RHG1]|nr:hypothetical protein [Caulobacter sp. RHG1]